MVKSFSNRDTMPNSFTPYPLVFEPIHKEKVWGGRTLEQLGHALPGDKDLPIGESWELVDLASTSVSGGGGGAEHSIIADGPWSGRGIDELLAAHQSAVLGSRTRAQGAGFPLLIKFLDARENLSVQVHPSPAYAETHDDVHLKSEAWYIIACDDDAVIYKGMRPGVTPDQLRAAIATNTDDAVVPLLNVIPVKPGDCHYLPSGTCHALGEGILVAEVQTPSDTTFRVYDWGRTGRELHVDQALACIDFAHTPKASKPSQSELGNFKTQTKASCEFFTITEVRSTDSAAATLSLNGAEVWIGLSGEITMQHDGQEAVALPVGRTMLLPAGLQTIDALATEGGRWLRVTIPQRT